MPYRRKRDLIIKGFSKLLKEDKLKIVAELMDNQLETIELLKSFWYADTEKQKIFDEFSENTITNFYIPYGIAPNVMVNGRTYLVPMVIEESSVVAAASSAARFWSERGGFHAEVKNTVKVGQIHFQWCGDKAKLVSAFDELKLLFRKKTNSITANMEKRGGGILDFELVDMRDKLENYYQINITFETVDSMGANFINSCLEESAKTLQEFVKTYPVFEGNEKEVVIIMSILSNYTPDCLVKVWVECDFKDLENIDSSLSGEEFARKFETAVKIAEIDTFRAATHNKGIFNGIDAVAIATGNDFRAIEAAGHAYASRDGHYKSLSHVEIKNGRFKYRIELPLALGTVGGLTSLHPLAKHSLEMLGKPSAKELMMITATLGMANNFAAVRSLVTKGIQQGHMKMHLMNILNHFKASQSEKEKAVSYFSTHKVSFADVGEFIKNLRLSG
ncbi:Hydroxymethylglutaryl-CoA reductase [hydrothermal vent metagenome]|uniref:Hydroxymethylglutaryl-CoA reductase n=1 Tax=hydrothermal vent metagenome TaxID=652676 RepID=A0A3B0UTJ2_9ZZZZ